jgi:hypothetical protein
LCESRWEITKMSFTVLFWRKGWHVWGTMDGNEISCAPHSIIPFHGILFPSCVVFFYGIFILWYLGCVLFLKHNIWCVITSTRKECSLCGNQYLILCFLYVLDALLSLQVDLINLIVAFSYLFYIHFPCPITYTIITT